MTRDQQIVRFLQGAGYGRAKAEPLAQDASFRRYLRVSGGPRPAVLMDAPPPEDVRPFLSIAAYLSGLSLSVPDILAVDADAGLLLEEDLGDALFSTILHDTTIETLFDAAVDALVVMHRGGIPGQSTGMATARGEAGTPQAAAPALPPWGTREMLSTALGTLFDWWWPAAFGTQAPAEARADIGAALAATLMPLSSGPVCFVHRDYFAGNLLWLPQRAGIRRVGVIDFQSGAIGPPAYDLVSLLQDARRDIPVAIAARGLDRYLAARPELDVASFRAVYAACAAQRHLRVACQWVRLALRDGRLQYLAYGPRTWRLLQDALTQPAAAPLAAALDRWIPTASRGNPSGLAI